MTIQNVFNRQSELAVRLIVILSTFNKPMDIQQLVYFDHLTLHFGDVDKAYASLHPSNPFHAVEYVVKRQSIQSGLNLAIRKGLIDVEYSGDGINYKAKETSFQFINYLESAYFKRLRSFAHMVCDRFKDYSKVELSNYFNVYVGRWKGEFEKEALFREEQNG